MENLVAKPSKKAPSSGGTAVAERVKMSAETDQYLKEVNAVRKDLVDLARESDTRTWRLAIKASKEAARLFALYERSLQLIYQDISEGSLWGPKTIKKACITVTELNEMEKAEIYEQPFSGFTQISDIVHAGLANDSKLGLLNEVYMHDKANPDKPTTVQAVRAKIAELKERDPSAKDWHRETDLWVFQDHDPRFGKDGYPGRLPGQAILNILDRWLPAGGVFLNAMCGSGTALDAAKYLKTTQKYYGFDLTPDERAVKKHGADRIFGFDAIDNVGHWNQIGIPDDEPVDLLLITPPHFSFAKGTSRSGKPTDLGNLSKPEDYLMVWNQIFSCAKSVLRKNGVIAVVTKATSEFAEGTPVPDIEGEIIKAMDAHGLNDMFLGRPIIHVKKEAHPKSTGKDRKPYLIPEVQTIHIYRVVS